MISFVGREKDLKSKQREREDDRELQRDRQIEIDR